MASSSRTLESGTPPPGLFPQHRRTSQKSANGHSDGSNSPISRTVTPSMYGNHLPVFNGHLDEHYNHHIHQSPSLPPMHIQRQPTPGRSTSPLNGHLGMTQTPEQLIAEISGLKTRVSELEVINDLFRSRVTQLETDESNSRHAAEMCRESEHNMSQQLEESRRREEPHLQIQLEESRRRENQLKHRLDDVERELKDLKESKEEGVPPAKKMRVADMVGDSEVSTPQSEK